MTDYFWKIEEAVNRGYYITHDGIFGSKDEAQTVIDHFPVEQRAAMRPAPYRTGHSTHGPERVETPR